MNNQKLYDIAKSFSDNFSLHIPINPPTSPPPTFSTTILNKRICSPIGIAACPVTVGSKIIELAKLGFGVITYKSVRSKAFAGHPLPNLAFIQSDTSWPVGSRPLQCIASATPSEDFTKLSLANSIGNASLAKEVMHADIQKSKRALSKDQVLAASIYGEGETPKAQANDFADLAELVIDAGADWVELNLSCPNLLSHGLIYQDLELMRLLVETVYQRIPKDIPLIAKLGFIADKQTLEKTLYTLAKVGIRGICGINTVSTPIVNEKGQAYFGADRHFAGVSGYAIHELAKYFIKQAVEINVQQKFDFAILATGGVTQANDFNHFLEVGADIAMSATAVLLNPYIADEFLKGKTR